MINKNDVVQFNEKHKWCGVLGIVTRIKSFKSATRYMIGIPIPEGDRVVTAYIYDDGSGIEKIGKAALIYGDN